MVRSGSVRIHRSQRGAEAAERDASSPVSSCRLSFRFRRAAKTNRIEPVSIRRIVVAGDGHYVGDGSRPADSIDVHDQMNGQGDGFAGAVMGEPDVGRQDAVRQTRKRLLGRTTGGSAACPGRGPWPTRRNRRESRTSASQRGRSRTGCPRSTRTTMTAAGSK